MTESAKKPKEATKLLDKVEFSVWLTQDMVDLLRDESYKKRISVSEIVSTALKSRYQSKPAQKSTQDLPSSGQSTTIRRVVLEVLEELGLHKQTGDKTRAKPNSKTTQKVDHKPEPSKPEIKPEIIFTDNANGTVTDNRTGLIWLKNANCFGKTDWETATANVNNLASGSCELSDASVAGDWHLPSREELESLATIKKQDPELPAGHPFTGVKTSNHWSSSVRDNDTLHAWVVYINRGRVNYTSKSGNYQVWPVKNKR